MLAVARALMSRPKLLLMDEPSLGLAPLVVEEIFGIIAELHRDGTTIFLVEQNAHMALKVAQHFYLMEQGKVTFSGDPGSLAEDEVIRRAYLGSDVTPQCSVIDFLQNTLDGLTLGSSYALLAVGFTLIFGVLRRANLSYGPAIMLGCYARDLGCPCTSTPGCWCCFLRSSPIAVRGRRLRRAPLLRARTAKGSAVAAMVASFALWMQLEELAIPRACRSTSTPSRRSYEAAPLALGPLTLRVESLVMLAAAIAVCARPALAALPHALRRRGARGYRPPARRRSLPASTSSRVFLLVFALASAIGGIAGFLIVATHEQVTPMLGMWSTLKGMLAMMLGGLGSLPGAVVGGLALGLIEAHSQWYLGPQLRDFVAYLLLFVLLALRPPWMTTRSAS